MINTGNEDRTYIKRLRRDPRLKAIFDGFIAQALFEAEERYQHPQDDRERMHYAAERAAGLAMTFVLDGDQEYQMVCAERDRLLEQAIKFAHLTPIPSFGAKVGPTNS